MYNYVRDMFRFCHWWFVMVNNPLQMYPYINLWIAKVRSLESNVMLSCLVCYFVLCGLCFKVHYCLKRVAAALCCWYQLGDKVDQCTHTYTLCMLTSSIGLWYLMKELFLIFSDVYYNACKVYVYEACYVIYHKLE